MANQEEKDSGKEERNIHLVEKRYSFVQKEWKVQRIFEVLMILFLAAGFLGLFGEGVLSEKTISGDGFEVKYQQYLRVKTPTELLVYLNNPPDTTVISFNSTYLEEVKIEQIVPQPIAAKTQNWRLFYTFNTASGGQIMFYLMPESPGKKELDLQIHQEVSRIEQFVYF